MSNHKIQSTQKLMFAQNPNYVIHEYQKPVSQPIIQQPLPIQFQNPHIVNTNNINNTNQLKSNVSIKPNIIINPNTKLQQPLISSPQIQKRGCHC
jgi:UDP-3-O-[3-hydroxymyristoyl] glucosamine N-acyltransferase